MTNVFIGGLGKGSGSGGGGSTGAGALKVTVATIDNVDLALDLEAGKVLNGVTLTEGMTVLAKDQDTASENGVYTAPASGAASRSSLADTAEKLSALTTVVLTGDEGQEQYYYTEPEITTIGVDDVFIKRLDYIDTPQMTGIIDDINTAAAKFNYIDVQLNANQTENDVFTKNDPNNRVDDFNLITGWDKTTYPTLYCKFINSDRITVSYSASDRTATSSLNGNGAASIIHHQGSTGLKQFSNYTPSNIGGYIRVNSIGAVNEEFEITRASVDPGLGNDEKLATNTPAQHVPQEESVFAVTIDGEHNILDNGEPTDLPVNLNINKDYSGKWNGERSYVTKFTTSKVFNAVLFGPAAPAGLTAHDRAGTLLWSKNCSDLQTAAGSPDVQRIEDMVADETHVYIMTSRVTQSDDFTVFQIDHTGTILKFYTKSGLSSKGDRLRTDGQNAYVTQKNQSFTSMFMYRYDFSTDTAYDVDLTDMEFAWITPTGSDANAYSGTYFEISDNGTDYYVWVNVDGGSVDPAPGGKTAVQVDINSTDDQKQISFKIAQKLRGVTGGNAFAAEHRGYLIFIYRIRPVNSVWTIGTFPGNITGTNTVEAVQNFGFSSNNRLTIVFERGMYIEYNKAGTVGNEYAQSTGRTKSLVGNGADIVLANDSSYLDNPTGFNELRNTFIGKSFWIRYYVRYNEKTYSIKSQAGGLGDLKIGSFDLEPYWDGSNYVFSTASDNSGLFISENKLSEAQSGGVVYDIEDGDVFMLTPWNVYVNETLDEAYLDIGDRYLIVHSDKRPKLFMSPDGGETIRTPFEVQEGDQLYIIPEKFGSDLSGAEKISFRYLQDQTVPNVGSGSGSGSGS